MAKLSEEARVYEPKQTKNIAELDVVDLGLDVEDREATNDEGKSFQYKVVIVDGEEYRVPKSVLSQIKAQQEENPKLSKVKVKKTGIGLNTTYTVIPLV